MITWVGCFCLSMARLQEGEPTMALASDFGRFREPEAAVHRAVARPARESEAPPDLPARIDIGGLLRVDRTPPGIAGAQTFTWIFTRREMALLEDVSDADPEAEPEEGRQPLFFTAGFRDDRASTPEFPRLATAEGPKTASLPLLGSPWESMPDHTDLKAGFLDSMKLRDAQENPLFQAIDHLMAIPAAIVEGLTDVVLPDRLSIAGFMLLDQTGAGDGLARTFTRLWVKREMALIADFARRYAVSEGEEAIPFDRGTFSEQHTRLLVDSLKKAYRDRYDIQRVDFDALVSAFSTGEWTDLVILPAVLGAYFYRFGFDRTISLGEDVRLGFQLERGSRIYKTFAHENHHHLADLSLNLFKLPFSIVAVFEGGDGNVELSFVGIGTDTGTVARALGAEEDDE